MEDISHQHIHNLKNKLLFAPYEVCIERALFWTEEYRRNEKESVVIKNAKALKNVLKNITIFIQDDELIVGNRTSKQKGAPLFPEIKSSWISAEIDTLHDRPVQPFYISPDDKKELKKILPYWYGKTVWDRAMYLMPKNIQKEVFKLIFTIGAEFANGIGHFLLGHNKVIKLGFKGIRNLAEEKLRSLNGSKEKKDFLNAVIIAVDGVSNFIKRFSELADDLSNKEKNKTRKNELIKISEICKNISDNPASNFYEALQLVWFVQLIAQVEDGGFAISFGRLDQILYPYYKRDIEDGRINPEFAEELVKCFYIKVASVVNVLENMIVAVASGPPIAQNLTIGGIDKEGDDATNELSYIFLDAYKNIKTSQPNFSIRVHKNIKEDFLIRICEAVRDGTSIAFFNDEIIIPSMINRGIPIDDARDYAIVGCVEPAVPGKTFGSTDSNLFNIAKCLELALNNGDGFDLIKNPFYLSSKLSIGLFSILSWIYNTIKFSKNVKVNIFDLIEISRGKSLGVKTGDARKFNSFDKVLDAYKKQVSYFSEKMVSAMYYCDKAHSELKPTPFLSSTVDDCIDKTKDLISGGAKYNFTGPQAVGIADVGDSLAVIKKFIFDEKKITMSELLKVLNNNFKDRENLRQMFLNKVPKYGNDNDYVDKLTKEGIEIYCKEIEKHKNFREGYFQPGVYSMSGHIIFGILTGATPDGRKRGMSLTEGVSPVHGREIKGPTSVLKSAAKLPHKLISNGNVLNMKFHPLLLQGDENIRKFSVLIKTYFELGGLHIQSNVVSKEILFDAQKNPEKYRGLVVRVAGYSAYFTELDKATQDDIIERTEYGV